jgi:hypothetical protein
LLAVAGLTQRVHQTIQKTADFTCLCQQELLFAIRDVLKVRSKDNVSLQFVERSPGDREVVQECAASIATRPSAIFAGIATAARRICELRPNLSWSGNRAVTRYVLSLNPNALCQTSKS